MKRAAGPDELWMLKHFPTAPARAVADAAIDALPVEASMREYIDTWLDAYTRAGGIVPWRIS